MLSMNIITHYRRILGLLLAVSCLAALWPVATIAGNDNPPLTDKVGAIDGEAISVEGPMSVDVVGGKVRTVLRSGSDVHVKTGQARIELIEGGHITICGPAHFSVLKSGGAITLALDTGTIHAFLQTEPALTVYTPQIQARPISIGNGYMETLVGLDSSGAMCIRATKGAVRIEQQLTGQSMLVPQNGDVSLTNGQLETLHTSAGHCVCEEQQMPFFLQRPGRGKRARLFRRTEEEGSRKESRASNSTPARRRENRTGLPGLHATAAIRRLCENTGGVRSESDHSGKTRSRSPHPDLPGKSGGRSHRGTSFSPTRRAPES